MKVFLLQRRRDFDWQRTLPANEPALTQDLELNILFDAMALGDRFLLETAKKVVLSSLKDPEEILYRQEVLGDCLKQAAIVREIYEIAVEAIEAEKKVYWGIFSQSPDAILHRSLDLLQLLIGVLKKLRHIADEHAGRFESEGFSVFFAMLAKELDDEYFLEIEDHLRQLRFRDGVLISAGVTKGLKGRRYLLHKVARLTWRQRISLLMNRSAYSFRIAERDETGARMLAELKDRGTNLVANALAQSTDHIKSFFIMLRSELGFYLGCLNLHEQLAQKAEPTCFPVPGALGTLAQSFHGLYDVCLALRVQQPVVGNDLAADHKLLVMITGANQGGKSTFLRSIGLAQLMMQCGMFVPADSFSSNLCQAIYTHFKREEDVTMKSGKLDEELSRMSDIADHIAANCVLLCNESFASTNEREGSEIARQIIRALFEAGVKVFFVTHLFDLAQGFYVQQKNDNLFLRADRQPDGQRTFRLIEGEPLPTSYGEDVYQRIFGGVLPG
jgi:DNA mismatch repair ATPase MutS